MGVPVSGKNLFPSNIAGLPTWFTIRVDERGWIARQRGVDVLVCMNPATVEQDVREVAPGTTVVYEETLKADRFRDDLRFVAAPFNELVREVCEPVALRRLVVNMIYVGVVAELLGIEADELERALGKAFASKPKALAVNRDALAAGLRWARANVQAELPVRVERRDLTRDKILVDGNTACAVGSLFAGCSVVTWYPITPSSSLAEAIGSLGHRFRRDPKTGRTNLAVLQAEDELAAIGMVLGAGWAGARSMTATSGPGISLMAEFIGLGYYAELPGVLFDIQRTGPSTGLPTRTMQGDVLKAAYLSHGDCRHPCLYPCDIGEAYGFAIRAFDLAERLQTPVFVLSDLDLGMNLWMADPFQYPEGDADRGKVLDAEALKKVEGWGRYKDVDGDAIPWRTLPGTPGDKGSFFTRGSGHDAYATYTEDGGAYVHNMDRLERKLSTAKGLVPAPVADGEGHAIGVLCFGTSQHAVAEAREQLREAHGLETDALRLCAFPFADAVREWIEAHDRVYVVEQNRDAQMRRMLGMDFPEISLRLRSVLHYDGLPLDAQSVVEGLLAQESGSAGEPAPAGVAASDGKEPR
jgi:2-oxoglutarate/2-oxoacid ferredoxin oxidoreductase subunit alpha